MSKLLASQKESDVYAGQIKRGLQELVNKHNGKTKSDSATSTRAKNTRK